MFWHTILSQFLSQYSLASKDFCLLHLVKRASNTTIKHGSGSTVLRLHVALGTCISVTKTTQASILCYILFSRHVKPLFLICAIFPLSFCASKNPCLRDTNNFVCASIYYSNLWCTSIPPYYQLFAILCSSYVAHAPSAFICCHIFQTFCTVQTGLISRVIRGRVLTQHDSWSKHHDSYTQPNMY